MSRKTRLRKREGYTVDDPSVIDEVNARLRKLMRTNATGKKIRLRKRDINRIAKAVTRNMKAVEFKMCLRREDGDHNEPPADSLVGVDGRYYRQTPDAGASGANDGSALYYTDTPVRDAPKFHNAEGYAVDKPSVVDEIVESTLDGKDSKSDIESKLFSYKELLDARDRAFADGFCCGRKRNNTESENNEEISIKESNPIVKFVDADGHEYSVKTIGHALDDVESVVERTREFPR